MDSVFVSRTTSESGVWVLLNEDKDNIDVKTGLEFLDEIVVETAKSSGVGLRVFVKSDEFGLLHIVAEDGGMAVGRAFKEVMCREGVATASAKVGRAKVDIKLVFDDVIPDVIMDKGGDSTLKCGDIYSEDVKTFFDGFAQGAQCRIEISAVCGKDVCEMWRAAGSAFGTALGRAIDKKLKHGGNVKFVDSLEVSLQDNRADNVLITVRGDDGKNNAQVILTDGLEVDYRKKIKTGQDFLNHMIEHIAWRSGFGIHVSGNAEAAEMGMALGRAFGELIDKTGAIGRGSSRTGMIDEAYADVKISFESRVGFNAKGLIPDEMENMKSRDLEMFLRGFARGANCTLWIDLRSGENGHHIWEAIFRGLGEALHEAVIVDEKLRGRTAGVAGKVLWEVVVGEGSELVEKFEERV